MGNEKHNTPESFVKNNFTKMPNWWFELMQHLPPSYAVVVAYLLRQFVGWHRWSFETTLEELAQATSANDKVVSRVLRAMEAIKWIRYDEGRNGGGKSEITCLHMPDKAEAQAFGFAVNNILRDETAWARGCEKKVDKEGAQYKMRPRTNNKDFVKLLAAYYQQELIKAKARVAAKAVGAR